MDPAIAAAAAEVVQAPQPAPSAAAPIQQQPPSTSTSAAVPESKDPLATPPPAQTTAAPTTVRSTALAYTPATLTIQPGTQPPELRSIYPWDLKTPIPLSDTLPVFYDASTAEYFLFTNQGAWLLYKTPRVTIPKKQARKFLDNFPSRDDVAAVIGAELKIPKCESGMLTDRLILYHAVHDSILVSRVKKDTSLFRFCEDKAIRTVSGRGTTFGNVYLQYIRPEFENIVPHTCQELYNCGNNVIYCGTCTAYRTATGVVNNTIQCSVPRMLGRVTVPINVARNLLTQCLEPGTTKLDFSRAYPVLGQCFNMFTISTIPAPPANMVINMLRDSLFVEIPYQGKGDGRCQRLNWANFFSISDQPQNDNGPISGSQATGNAAAGAKVVGAGVAVGLGIASLLLG
ncbi:hypothetical protein BJX68DRAFT_54318 [Aspergillus pseudodeflectus]|uniref:Uncharacterized protein n=1 Tax=Aspergillus pseudodeflectus TaxID=176178 RepID=A0ABR4KJZ2_9EURO